MNKEVMVAVIIGIAMGIGGALYFSNTNVTSKSIPNALSLNANVSTPKLSSKDRVMASFGDLPDQGSLVTKSTLKLSGKADNKSILIAANRLSIVPLTVKKNAFSEEFRLKPGANELVLYELNKDKEQLKLIRLYYLELAKQSQSTNEESTEEADLLKEKLESKVIELRNNPQKVLNGEIKGINGKVLDIEEMGKIVKVTVEPEITNFSSMTGYNLSRIEFADLKKGDQVTAFISDIGGDEISYTVYQEPEITVAAGKVSNIDDDNYKVTLIDFDKSSYGADIETGTDQTLYNSKTRKVEEAGFSKLAIGQRIFARLSGVKGSYSIDEYLIID